MSLQGVIEKVLSSPIALEGGRHDDILHRMAQLHANGVAREASIEAVASLYPIGSGARKITRKELEDAYDGASKLGYKPWDTTPNAGTANYRRYDQQQAAAPKAKSYEPTGRRELLPTNLAEMLPGDILAMLYKPDDYICLTRPDAHDGKPRKDNEIRMVKDWVDWINDDPLCFSTKHGFYFLINPLIDHESERKNEQVARFPYTLVELEVPKDKRASMSREEKRAACEVFYGTLLDSNLPLAAAYTSGDASIHGLVRVDASDQKQFEERVEQVYDYCATMPGFDKTNRNSARLSRLPGVMRGKEKQTLLSLSAGAKSFEEWQWSVQPRLFEIEDPNKWTDTQLELPPVLIEGWLHKSHLGMLTGSMKTNKSWTLLELAICFAKGLKWFNRECRQSTVLYIDAEIQRPFWRQRAEAICRQREIEYIDVIKEGRIRPAFVAGKNITATSIRLELERLFERGALDDVDVIVIDPIYQFYDESWDENGNSDMSKLGKILRAIAELTSVSILFAHHHSKGSQDGKRDIEKASGGGAFGRFVASSLAITLIDEESRKYTLGWTTTNFKPSPKQVAYRDEFEWRITDEDPKEAVKNHRTIDDIMSCLPDAGLTSEHWLAACREQFDISDGAFEKLRPKAKKAGRCYLSKSSDKWEPTTSEIENRGSCLPVSDDE
jgi:RecA-family ATPase